MMQKIKYVCANKIVVLAFRQSARFHHVPPALWPFSCATKAMPRVENVPSLQSCGTEIFGNLQNCFFNISI
jgi:hypothetical protein